MLSATTNKNRKKAVWGMRLCLLMATDEIMDSWLILIVSGSVLGNNELEYDLKLYIWFLTGLLQLQHDQSKSILWIRLQPIMLNFSPVMLLNIKFL